MASCFTTVIHFIYIHAWNKLRYRRCINFGSEFIYIFLQWFSFVQCRWCMWLCLLTKKKKKKKSREEKKKKKSLGYRTFHRLWCYSPQQETMNTVTFLRWIYCAAMCVCLLVILEKPNKANCVCVWSSCFIRYHKRTLVCAVKIFSSLIYSVYSEIF